MVIGDYAISGGQAMKTQLKELFLQEVEKGVKQDKTATKPSLTYFSTHSCEDCEKVKVIKYYLSFSGCFL
jgi:hypothetical protein